MSIIKELKILLEQTKNKSITEWSVGDLGKDINKNITDKVSLKSIKVGDVLVIAQTSIYPVAKGEGDAQLTIESIDGTKVNAVAENGDDFTFDLLDMRILEAYTMDNDDFTVFVIDLPNKIDNKNFKESKNTDNPTLSDINKNLDDFIKRTQTLSENLFDIKYGDREDEKKVFDSSKEVKTAKNLIDEVYSYIESISDYVKSKIDKRSSYFLNIFLNETIETKQDLDKKEFFYLITGIDRIAYDLQKIKKSFNDPQKSTLK